MKSKNNFLALILLSFLIFGCTSDESITPYEEDEQYNDRLEFVVVDFDLKQIKNVESNELISFFGRKSSDDLIALKTSCSEKNADSNILMLIEKSYSKNPEDASKAVYVDNFGDTAYMTHSLRKTEEPSKSNRGFVEIFDGMNNNASYTIEYDLENEYAELILPKKSYNDCVDGCVHGELDSIFNQGSWIRRAAFIATAGTSYMLIVADCMWDCA